MAKKPDPRKPAIDDFVEYNEAGSDERCTLSCLNDRSSRPHQSPRMLSAEAQERICEVRRHTGWRAWSRQQGATDSP